MKVFCINKVDTQEPLRAKFTPSGCFGCVLAFDIMIYKEHIIIYYVRHGEHYKN